MQTAAHLPLHLNRRLGVALVSAAVAAAGVTGIAVVQAEIRPSTSRRAPACP